MNKIVTTLHYPIPHIRKVICFELPFGEGTDKSPQRTISYFIDPETAKVLSVDDPFKDVRVEETS